MLGVIALKNRLSVYMPINLIQSSQKSLFLFQSKDGEGDEVDGYDETICPVDYASSGQIVDDEMNALLVQRLPPGVRLTAIFDSCHSQVSK